MTMEQLHELTDFRANPAVQELMEYITQYLSYTHGWLSEEETDNLREKQYKLYRFIVVHDLIDKHPEELGFVLQAKDYQDYVASYETVSEDPAKDAELTEDEFNIIKSYFTKEE